MRSPSSLPSSLTPAPAVGVGGTLLGKAVLDRGLWVAAAGAAREVVPSQGEVRVPVREVDLTDGTTFAIYDTSDQMTLIRRCMRELNMNDDAFPPRSVLTLRKS